MTSATGDAISYQWYEEILEDTHYNFYAKDNVEKGEYKIMQGQTTDTLALNQMTKDAFKRYKLEITNGGYTVNVYFTLVRTDLPKVSVKADKTSLEKGETAVLTAKVTNLGDKTATYQWYKNGKKIDGATAATYTTEATGFAVNGETSVVTSGDVKIPDGAKELVQLGGISFAMPETDKTAVYDLILTIDGTPYKNKYELYCYPVNDDVLSLENIASIGEGDNQVFITNEFTETKSLLKQGKKVLFMPNEVKESLEGFYCTDFWCYPMFRDICEWMKKPVAVGTMGLLIDSSHPALNDFATHRYSTPQWYKIVSHSRCAILDDVTDKDYRPIVQMADNFERNHKLGILFEGKAGDGKLMVCTSKLGEIAESTEVKHFIKSLVNYLTSDVFAPEKELDLEKLETIF